MQNPVPDERYSVTDEAILGAFFKLIKKKTPDQITVSDITKTAGIARSTFYNHYQDIPSLVSAVEEKTSARPGRHTKEEISYVITCAIGSTIGVLHKWTRDNFDLAPEVIAGILTQIFLSGMLPLLS